MVNNYIAYRAGDRSVPKKEEKKEVQKEVPVTSKGTS